MKKSSWLLLSLALLSAPVVHAQKAKTTTRGTATLPTVATRWPAAKATAWYQVRPWMTGANFIPSSAINQLEMWQAATFDAPTIDKELGWAEGIGFNTMRVFLHNLAWKEDPAGFKKRMNDEVV